MDSLHYRDKIRPDKNRHHYVKDRETRAEREKEEEKEEEEDEEEEKRAMLPRRSKISVSLCA